MFKLPILAVTLAAALPQAGVVEAAAVDFSGNATATAIVAPSSACSPALQGVATGTGTSSLGSFTYNHTACTTGATGPVTGTFNFVLGADSLFGTLVGTSVLTPAPGFGNLLFTYTITGGTGQYLNATGTFAGAGTADFRNAPPSRLTLAFGSAVPEPATWAMMLLGFGAIGLTMRRRRENSGPQANLISRRRCWR